jgi:hypothetical protein
LTIASGVLVSGRDTTGLARFAVALYAFVNVTLHFMSDDRLREKVALRGGGLSFLLVLCLEYAYRRQRSRSF